MTQSQVLLANETNRIGAIVAACLMSAAGAAVFLVLPILVGAAVDSLHLNNEQAGFLVSAYNVSYALIGISAFFWIRRVNWRLLALCGYAALSGGLSLAALTPDIVMVTAGMLIAGAGAGALFGLGVTVVADTPNPDQNFGFVLVAQQLVAAVLLFWLPAHIVSPWGFSGLCWALAAVLGVMVLSLPWLPNSGKPHPVSSKIQGGLGVAVLIGLLALTVYFAALSSIWAFIERAAADKGLAHNAIGDALAISMIGGVIGGFAAATLGDRYGRRGPMLLATLVFFMVFWLLAGNIGFNRFTIAVSLFSLAWNFVLAYQMGSVAAHDSSGRASVLMPAAQAVGAVIGPAAGGMALSGLGFTGLLVGGGLGLLLSLLPFLLLERSPKVALVAG